MSRYLPPSSATTFVVSGGGRGVTARCLIELERPRVLNVAGPRASEDADIYVAVATLLRMAAAQAPGPK